MHEHYIEENSRFADLIAAAVALAQEGLTKLSDSNKRAVQAAQDAGGQLFVNIQITGGPPQAVLILHTREGTLHELARIRWPTPDEVPHGSEQVH